MIRFFVVLMVIFFCISTLTLTLAEEVDYEKEGHKTGKDLKTRVFGEAGHYLYGPATGQSQWQTFDKDNPTTFDASITASQDYQKVAEIKFCLTISSGELGFAIQNDNGGTFQIQPIVIGEYGYATGTPPDLVLHKFSFSTSSNQLSPVIIEQDVDLAAIGAPLCVSKDVCDIDDGALWANYGTIIAKIRSAINWAVNSADSNLLTIPGSVESSTCESVIVLQRTEAPTGDNLYSCWTGVGNLPVCESIQKLKERGTRFERGASSDGAIMTAGEKVAIASRATELPFYKSDEDSRVRISQPYKLVTENAQGATMSGEVTTYHKTRNCVVSNLPWGGLGTGWINYIGDTICQMNDWDCINRKVSDSCGAYELDESCSLLRETIDGVVQTFLGQPTGMGASRSALAESGACEFIAHQYSDPEHNGWDRDEEGDFFDLFAPQFYKDYLAGLGLNATSDDERVFKPDYIPDRKNFRVCGDFFIIERSYYCKTEEIDETQQSIIEAASGANQIVSSLEAERGFNPATDRMTGYFTKADGAWQVNPFDSQEWGTGIQFKNKDLTEDCIDDEKVCVIKYCAANVIYNNARPRSETGDPNNPAPQGPPTPSSECPYGQTIRKAVRQCEREEGGNLVCPITEEEESTGVWIDKDCGCHTAFGDAIGYLALLKSLPDDIMCGGECVDETTCALDELEESNDLPPCPDQGDAAIIYTCGEGDTLRVDTSTHLCEPVTVAHTGYPLRAGMWVDEDWRCRMSYVHTDGKWHFSKQSTFPFGTTPPEDPEEEAKRQPTHIFAPVVPYANWYDYCWDVINDKTLINPSSVIGRTGFISTSVSLPVSMSILDTYLVLSNNTEVGMGAPPMLCSEGPGDETVIGKSRTDSVCGYDVWTVKSGPSRVNNVLLTPTVEWKGFKRPFGFVALNDIRLTREYDCDKVGFDCNGDLWLDCFDCTWRDAGYDCNHDCIKDNNPSHCPQAAGYDCNNDNVAEYSSCVHREGGYDYNNDCIKDYDAPQMCPADLGVTPNYEYCGFTKCEDCTGCSGVATLCTGTKNYLCFANSSSPPSDYLSGLLTQQHPTFGYCVDQCLNNNNCQGLCTFTNSIPGYRKIIRSTYYDNNNGYKVYTVWDPDTSATWDWVAAESALDSHCQDYGFVLGTAAQSALAVTGPDTYYVFFCPQNSGEHNILIKPPSESCPPLFYTDAGNFTACINEDCSSNVKVKLCHMSSVTLLKQPSEFELHSCDFRGKTYLKYYDDSGNLVFDMETDYMEALISDLTCWKCEKPVPGKEVEEGWYCKSSGSVSGCSYDVGPDTIGSGTCVLDVGPDCGTNNGSESNDTPDGLIDDRIDAYYYCPKVQEGWDCSGGPCRSGLSFADDRIELGSCSLTANLADSNCGVSASDRKSLYCSREDFPGQCCQQDYTINWKIRLYLQLSALNPDASHWQCDLMHLNSPSGDVSIASMVLEAATSSGVNAGNRIDWAEYKIKYDNPDTVINETSRFLTEGCRDAWNQVIFEKTAQEQ